MRETLPINKILQQFWEDKNPLVHPLIPRVLMAWQEVVPDTLRSGLYLERFQEGILHILISNPVAGQQFQCPFGNPPCPGCSDEGRNPSSFGRPGF
jgi:Dna[CI] antecedent, DciA